MTAGRVRARCVLVALLAGVECATAQVLPPAPVAATDAATDAVADAGAALPAEIDLRTVLAKFGLKPRSQGRRSTCSVFTTTTVIEFTLARHAGLRERLSPEYLNWACNQITGNRTRDRGQFFHDLLNGFAQHGICREEDMLYTDKFDPQLAPSTAARAEAAGIGEHELKVHWIRRWTRRQGLSDKQFAEIKLVLAGGRVVAAGSDHSRTLVGYRDDPDEPGGGIFLTLDSGSGTFDSITYEFAKSRIGDAFWMELLETQADDQS